MTEIEQARNTVILCARQLTNYPTIEEAVDTYGAAVRAEATAQRRQDFEAGALWAENKYNNVRDEPRVLIKKARLDAAFAAYLSEPT